MNRMQRAVVGITMLALPVVMSACATVAPQAQVTTVSVARAGDAVQLFHGGNKLAKDEFCVNAVAPVYRFYPPYASVTQRSQVGKIRITGVSGDHYVEGVVVEGTIKSGDIAVLPNSECLVRLPEHEER